LRQADRQTGGQEDGWTGVKQTGIQEDKKMAGHRIKQTGRQVDRRTRRWLDTASSRQVGRRTRRWLDSGHYIK
jgi:hypothetical protein